MSGPGPGRGPGAEAVARALAALPSPSSLVTDEQLAERDDPAVGDLLDALPAILADAGPPGVPSPARAIRVRVPEDADRYTAAVDELLAEPVLEGLEERPLSEADRIVEVLLELETALSVRRRALFTRIDALRAELAERYEDGRADVLALLG